MTQDPLAVYKNPGLAMFAGILAGILGAMNLIYGILLLANAQFVALTEEGLFYVDVTAWAWVLVIFGVIQILASIGILQGRTWARLVGIAWASLIVLGNMFAAPGYPVWSLLIIGLGILVIYGLAAGMEDA